MKLPKIPAGSIVKKIAGNDAFLLYCALTAGCLLLILQVCFSVELYRDSASVYSPMVRDLLNGNYKDAFHPAIPSLNVILSAPLSALGLPPEKSLSLVSGLFYIGTIPFVYLLLAVFLPGKMASFGSLCFACAPKIIRFSCCALIDSGKIFFITAAMYFLVRIIVKKYKSWKYASLFGLALGGTTLARSEGLGNAVALFGCLGLYWLLDSFRERTIQPIRSLIVPLPFWSGCVLFRMLVNWYFCGVFLFDERISNGLSKLFRIKSGSTAVMVEGTERVLRVSYVDLISQYSRGSYEVYLLLSLIGLALILVSRHPLSGIIWPHGEKPDFLKWNRLYWIFPLVSFSNAVIFKVSDLSAYRYFLLNIPCMMLFTVIAACWIWKWCIRFLPAFIPIAAVLVILVWQVRNGADRFFSESAKKQYETGKRIGALLEAEKDTAKVWFGIASVEEWYYSGTKRAVAIEVPKPDILSFKNFDYAIWSEDQDDFEILKTRKDLREIPLAEAKDIHLYKRVDNE